MAKKQNPNFPALMAGGDVTPIDNESPLDLWGEVDKAKSIVQTVLKSPEFRDSMGMLNELANNRLKSLVMHLTALLTAGFVLEGSRGEQRGALHEISSLLKGPLGEITAGGAGEDLEVVFRNQEKWSKEDE